MPKIVIIGAGFSGLEAVKKLSRYRRRYNLQLTLVDKQERFNFLPLLPDVMGRAISSEYLTHQIEPFCKKRGCAFLHAGVDAVDLEHKRVSTSSAALNYDYLIIASGSETNFYGNALIHERAYPLDNAKDAERIKEDLERKPFDVILIAGAGYTGIEVATNMRLYLNKKSQKKKIIIVERAPSILGPLPEWMKDYVFDNLKSMDVEVLCNTTVERIDESGVKLSGREVLGNAMLIWSAGVRTADFLQRLSIQKNPQGRAVVDPYLRLKENCFVTGDASWYNYGGQYLRMAVQFSIMEGRTAASNIIRHIRGQALKAFRPFDFGYIIPMANNRSCGIVLGIALKGRLPTALHYLMCMYRSYSFRNKVGILKDVINS